MQSHLKICSRVSSWLQDSYNNMDVSWLMIFQISQRGLLEVTHNVNMDRKL